MEAEESAVLAAQNAKGERPSYYYCNAKTGPVILKKYAKYLLTV